MHNIMNDELNDDWINNFEENDKLYKDFYKDNLCYVNIDLIYINIVLSRFRDRFPFMRRRIII